MDIRLGVEFSGNTISFLLLLTASADGETEEKKRKLN